MDNTREPIENMPDELVAGTTIAFPPKYRIPGNRSSVWLRSLVSLALYLIIGYYIFPSYKILLLITIIVIIHELGHFVAMKLFGYNDLGIFFIPLMGAYVSGTKREVSQKESAIILMAGPIPGILIGILFFQLWQANPYYGGIAGVSYYTISLLFVLLNLFNLLPVYPLDGGQLLNRVFLDEDNWMSRIFIFLSAALLGWIAWKLNFPLLFIFPALMLFRMAGEKRMTAIEKKIEAEGINTDVDYDDLPDEDYWKIRNILIEEHPVFKDIPPAPPYEYHDKEERLMTTIQGLLHRHLLQDVSLAGKIFIFLLWAAAFASPWLLNMDMSFFSKLGF